MPSLVRSLCLAMVLMLGASGFAAEARMGMSKSEVIGTLGTPAGSVVVGPREILTYAKTSVVLQDGKVVELRATGAESGAAITVVRARPVEWIDSLDEARRRAAAEKKQILVLFTTDNPPRWATAFERAVVGNHTFLRQLTSDFVLLRLHVTADQDGKGLNALDAANRIADLRKRAVGEAPLPALAIVSPDASKAKAIDLSPVATAPERAETLTARAILSAKDKPLGASAIPGKAIILAFAVIAAGFVLFRSRKHESTPVKAP